MATDPLYRLLAWLSPAYPIGAFSYSHGVETAVEEGIIKDRAGLVTWLESVLRLGTGVVDGALCVAAWRTADAEDWTSFDAIAERAAAWRGTRRGRWNAPAGRLVPVDHAHRLAASDARGVHERLSGELSLPVAVGAGGGVHGNRPRPRSRRTGMPSPPT